MIDCRICGGIETTYFNYSLEPTEYRGINAQLPLFFMVCTECGSESADHKLSAINKEMAVNFHFAVDKYKEENNV